MDYLKARLREQSTWMGLAGITTAIHYWITDIEFDSFVALLVGISGVITIVLPEK